MTNSIENETKVKKASKSRAAYTEEQRKEIVAAYNVGEGVSVPDLAVKYNKPERSIISLLSQQKVYVKPVKESKNKGITKEDLAEQIIDRMHTFDPDVINPDLFVETDLEKVNKRPLTGILALVSLCEALLNGDFDEEEDFESEESNPLTENQAV